MGERTEDNFAQYFAEKIWEMIPAIYRYEDEIAKNPGVLRAFVEIIAEQAAIVRRSHDRLWEDQFIELCDAWVIPYIGDLLGTRLVSDLNKRALRVDVAKTIYYRRRKGTLRVLEELISDIAGWEGKVIEQFQHLGRTKHNLDPQSKLLRGQFSATPVGGTADLRSSRAAKLSNTAFDEYYHTPDVRQHSGLRGRYNIPKIAFYIYRLRSFYVRGVTPFPEGNGTCFTFDPSGRDIPLFMPRQRPNNWDEWTSAKEWELPAPIPCELLGHAEYQITEKTIDDLQSDQNLGIAVAANKLKALTGYRCPTEMHFKILLDSLQEPLLTQNKVYREILRKSIVTDCGKSALLPKAIYVEENQNTPVDPIDIAAGNLSQWIKKDVGKKLIIDPERGRFEFSKQPSPSESSVSYYYGFSGVIGAGTYNRPNVELRQPSGFYTINYIKCTGTIPANRIKNLGVTQIDDNATYKGIGNKLQVRELTLQAANQHRPYVRLQQDWMLRTPPNADAKLVIDGIWFGSKNDNVGNQYVVRLRGDYEEVYISHTTFDPGGGKDIKGNIIQPLPLIIEAQVEKLYIQNSIMGPISVMNGGLVDDLIIEDSIVDGTSLVNIALQQPMGNTHLSRVTIFGETTVNRLWASDSIITGKVNVTDTQNGCFRFSAAPINSRLPRFYESVATIDANYFFNSQRFGDPQYGQLSESAPDEIKRGAENGSEMGAFCTLLNPIKLESVKTKVDEYLPFGLIPIFVFET